MKQVKWFWAWTFLRKKLWIFFNHHFLSKSVHVRYIFHFDRANNGWNNWYTVCWIRTKTCIELTHIGYNGMSNRLLFPIRFASKMWYRSPVIWKVVCVKVENFEIGLLWCFNFPPVNYKSISKQKRFKFSFNPTLRCQLNN